MLNVPLWDSVGTFFQLLLYAAFRVLSEYGYIFPKSAVQIHINSFAHLFLALAVKQAAS